MPDSNLRSLSPWQAAALFVAAFFLCSIVLGMVEGVLVWLVSLLPFVDTVSRFLSAMLGLIGIWLSTGLALRLVGRWFRFSTGRAFMAWVSVIFAVFLAAFFWSVFPAVGVQINGWEMIVVIGLVIISSVLVLDYVLLLALRGRPVWANRLVDSAVVKLHQTVSAKQI